MATAMKSKLVILIKDRKQNGKMGMLLRNRESGRINLDYELYFRCEKKNTCST